MVLNIQKVTTSVWPPKKHVLPFFACAFSTCTDLFFTEYALMRVVCYNNPQIAMALDNRYLLLTQVSIHCGYLTDGLVSSFCDACYFHLGALLSLRF